MPGYQRTAPPARSWRSLRALVVLPVVLVLILAAARTIASYVIEYRWWQEMNQVPTWLALMLYGFAPVAGATLLAFAVLFGAHERGMKFVGIKLREHARYATISTAVLENQLLLGELQDDQLAEMFAVAASHHQTDHVVLISRRKRGNQQGGVADIA